MNLKIKEVQAPKKDNSKNPVLITNDTILERKEKIIKNMKALNISSLVIYADKEHGSNFEYLTGFIPRFEEALQILNQDGSSTLILGNENYNKTEYALVKSEGVLCPLFSLPNQPMGDFKPLTDYLKPSFFDMSAYVGMVDWKLLSNDYNEIHHQSAIPSFIVDS